MIDLLEAVRKGLMTVDEAQDKFDRIFSNPEEFPDLGADQTWVDYFGFSKYEATAIAHGADIALLVRYRYDGWPTICYRCGKPLDYTNFHWSLMEDQNGKVHLIHVPCP